MMAGSVVDVVGVVPGVALGAGVSVNGVWLGVTSGVTAGTVVVVGDVDVLDAATLARTPTPATLPAATKSVRLPTQAHPASRWAGVRGELVTPLTLADPCKNRTSRR